MSNTQWEDNYTKLKEYAKEHGHCNVPYNSELRYFAKWVGRQRSCTNLTKEQKNKLTKIGFDWRSQREREDSAWIERYQRLVDFKAINGHCDVPLIYDDDRELGTWVANQRKRNKQKKVRQDRVKMLNDVGFTWMKNHIQKRVDKKQRAYGKKWKEMFEKLVRFKEENGHCDVPYNYNPHTEDSSLGPWVSTQRRVYNKKTYLYGGTKEMNRERVNLLVSIGFNFGSKKHKSNEGDDVRNVDVDEELTDGEDGRCTKQEEENVMKHNETRSEDGESSDETSI